MCDRGVSEEAKPPDIDALSILPDDSNSSSHAPSVTPSDVVDSCAMKDTCLASHEVISQGNKSIGVYKGISGSVYIDYDDPVVDLDSNINISSSGCYSSSVNATETRSELLLASAASPNKSSTSPKPSSEGTSPLKLQLRMITDEPAVPPGDAVIHIDKRSLLEVEDPRHRYGKNLRAYYEVYKKLPLEDRLPFFEWLDSAAPEVTTHIYLFLQYYEDALCLFNCCLTMLT